MRQRPNAGVADKLQMAESPGRMTSEVMQT